jgi:hypothetical protein
MTDQQLSRKKPVVPFPALEWPASDYLMILDADYSHLA